jgi:hypothetical protein
MKAVALFALLAPLGANAHYIFNRLIVNGAAIGGDYAYVRKNTNSYMPSLPSELMNSPDLRCNKGAKAGGTATYTVKAGDKLGFKVCSSLLYDHAGDVADDSRSSTTSSLNIPDQVLFTSARPLDPSLPMTAPVTGSK